MKKQTKLGLVLAAAAVISVSVASLVSAKGWVQKGADWYYVDNDGEAITDTIQSSGTAKFYLGPDDGAMQKDYFLEDKDGQSYYFGSNGAMVTNTWVAIEASRVDNQQDYVPDNYWYYFQASGKAMKGTSGSPKKTTIDGKKYLFNEYGQMLTGWIEKSGTIINPDDNDNPYETACYYAGGDNDGVLRAGWVTYYDGYSGDDEWLNDKTNLYFYFNTSNNQKIGYDGAKTKKINGKTYAFDNTGVMFSGWDIENKVGGSEEITSLQTKTVYFSGEDDGHQVKKGWVYTVPASSIDGDAYDDSEEKYMYFNSSGDAVKDSFKKINGKYYVFNAKGIMKTGLVMWIPSLDKPDGTKYESHFLSTVDLDWATGEDMSKKGIVAVDSGENDKYVLDRDGYIISNKGGTKVDNKWTNAKVKFHYFGDDGARKTGTNNIEFSDDTFQINTNAQGDKGSGNFAKKYYSLGIVLKASSDIKYGIYTQDISTATGQFASQINVFATRLATSGSTASGSYGYNVLTTSGGKQKGATSAKKDADGNFWFISKSTDKLVGIWTVNIKSQSTGFTYAQKPWFDADDKVAYEALTTDAARSAWVKSNVTFSNHQGVHNNQYGFDAYITNWSGNDTDGYNATIKIDTSGLWFQTDYNGSSNKWLPFGWLDDAGKTCYSGSNYSDSDYLLEPTNDYFLNCYWSN